VEIPEMLRSRDFLEWLECLTRNGKLPWVVSMVNRRFRVAGYTVELSVKEACGLIASFLGEMGYRVPRKYGLWRRLKVKW